MIELSTVEHMAILLMLAYLHPDRAMRPAYVMDVFDRFGVSHEGFDLANCTAWTAAQFWWDTNPDLGRRMLEQKLEHLTGVPA